MNLMNGIPIAILTLYVALCPEQDGPRGVQADAAVRPTGTDRTAEAAPEPRFPETIAGRRAAAFIEAFNANDGEVIRAFEKTHRAQSTLKTRPIEARVEQAGRLFSQWGRIEVVDIVADGERNIVVIARASRSGDGLEMDFKLEEQEPFGLVAIRIAMSQGGPRAGGLVQRLDAEGIASTVEAIAAQLADNYVYPKKGDQLAKALRRALAADEYSGIDNARTLASRLTSDLQDICHDKHLAIRAGHIEAPPDDPDDEDESWWARGRWENHGFVKVERLEGNVGYIKLNEFSPGEPAKLTAAAAMNFLANTDALIFDLRDNGGGSADMIAFLSGYLFDERVHLNSFYHRPDESTTETWSETEVPGVRFGQDKPVYVLTSSHTFSAAEEFSYDLKHLKRATIVGETTGGGAHPVKRHKLNGQFWMTVPFARAINPITKTNWEGVGVKPHVEVAASIALETAHRLALAEILEGNRSPDRADKLRRILQYMKSDVATSQRP